MDSNLEPLEPTMYSLLKTKYMLPGFGIKAHILNSKFFAVRFHIQIWKLGYDISFWRRND